MLIETYAMQMHVGKSVHIAGLGSVVNQAMSGNQPTKRQTSNRCMESMTNLAHSLHVQILLMADYTQHSPA